MKNSKMLSALTAGTLAVGLALGGATGASAAPAIACAPDTSLDVTSEFFEPLALNDGDYDDFADQLVDFGDQQIVGFRGEIDALFGGHNAVPPALAAFADTRLPEIYARFVEAGNGFVQRAEHEGGANAAALKDLLSATYAYDFDVVNEFVAAYNEDRVWEILDPQSPNREHETLLNVIALLMNLVPQVGMYSSYQQLGSDFSLTVDLTPAYVTIYDGYTRAGLDAQTAEERTYASMRDSVAAWIERIDIDYITAYQAQVRQYLSMSQSMGLVYDLQEEEAVFDVGQAGTRPLILADLGAEAVYGFSLDETFFNMTVNADGTEFMTPTEVYESADFQALVTWVMDDLNTLTDFSAGSVTSSVTGAIDAQYNAMMTPGSSSQPIVAALPEYLIHYFALYNGSLTDASRGGLTPIPDWRDEAIVPGETPYDTDRAKNYLDIPFTVLAKGGKHEVTREITYNFEDGRAAAPTETQRAEFTCLQDAFTDVVEWAPADQEVTLPAPAVPEVTYPGDGATVLPPASAVGSLLVRPDDKNSVASVIFPLEFSVTVKFVDGNGDPLRDPETVTGRWNTPFAAKAKAIDGYTLRSAAAAVNGTFGTDTDPVVFVYDVAGDGGIDPGTPLPEKPGVGSPPPLAHTGSIEPWGIGIGAVILLIAGAATVLTARRRTH